MKWLAYLCSVCKGLIKVYCKNLVTPEFQMLSVFFIPYRPTSFQNFYVEQIMFLWHVINLKPWRKYATIQLYCVFCLSYGQRTDIEKDPQPLRTAVLMASLAKFCNKWFEIKYLECTLGNRSSNSCR